MNLCRQYQEWIWLAVYNELEASQKKQLDEHLIQCPGCTVDYLEAQQAVKLMNQKYQFQPDEKQIQAERDELHQRLLFIKHKRVSSGWKEIVMKWLTMNFEPQWRPAIVVAFMFFGLLMGHFLLESDGTIFKRQQDSLLNLKQADIAGVESVEYNPTSKQMEIKYRTIHENMLIADPDKPEIQYILARTLVSEERTNIRLKTVNALSMIKNIDQPVLNVLIKVLQDDTNSGVRLKAIRLINSIPINTQIRELIINTLTTVLLTDENPAIRNEAIDGLSKINNADAAALIVNTAKGDSNEYLKFKAGKVVKHSKIERQNY